MRCLTCRARLFAPRAFTGPIVERFSVAALFVTLSALSASLHAEQRRFTVTDDIELSVFVGGDAGPVVYSADKKYFVVNTYRGRVNSNRVESTLRFYKTQDIYQILVNRDAGSPPLPIWTVERSFSEGPVITQVRWTATDDVAFLSKAAAGVDQLFLANISERTVATLTPENEEVTAYDIRTPDSFVYTVLSPRLRQRKFAEFHSSSFDATGRMLFDLMQPKFTMSELRMYQNLSELWVYSKGKRLRILDTVTGRPLPINASGVRAMSLSPDGRAVVTTLTLSRVPSEWETLYLPAPNSPHRIREGDQDPFALFSDDPVSQYVLIEVPSGKVRALAGAPTGDSAGYWGTDGSAWSSDGQFIVLGDTFLRASRGTDIRENRPCVAIADSTTGNVSCLQEYDPDTSKTGTRLIDGVSFPPGSSSRVVVHFVIPPILTPGVAVYVHGTDGRWAAATGPVGDSQNDQSLDISVKQDMNHSPLLVAKAKHSEAEVVILDPNPQLRSINLAPVTKLNWKDNARRDWIGGLYMPPAYKSGKRYPLVIQTHGFDENTFAPSGAFTTAFAAQELAATGIVVLQVQDCPIRATPAEGPCQVDGYESAIHLLVEDGLVDPNAVGIIGFSRTCFYVLQALTTSPVRFAAASITDGVNLGYLQHLLEVDDGVTHGSIAMIGAPPVGEGLQQWLEHSPEFNLDKVTAPLLVEAPKGSELLFNWEPYAVLRYLNKPVNLIVLNSEQHVLTNPSVREASQGANIDWFRFWLQGYEDPDPSKRDQYERWKHLKELQEVGNKVSGRTSTSAVAPN